MAKKIFINYRREDSAAHALSIAQYLEKEFGSGSVFIDVDKMRVGDHFPTVLQDRLSRCGVMIVVIGPSWLLAADGDGRRRLDNEKDWVRREIVYALKEKLTVIPVLVGGAALPKDGDLPVDLKPLTEQHVARVTTNGFKNDMAGLTRDLSEVIGRGGTHWYIGAVAAVAVGVAAISVYALGSKIGGILPTKSQETSAVSEEVVRACGGIAAKYQAFGTNLNSLADMSVASDSTTTREDVLASRETVKKAHAHLNESLATLELVGDPELRRMASDMGLEMQNIVNNATGLKDLGDEKYRDLRAGLFADFRSLLAACQKRLGVGAAL